MTSLSVFSPPLPINEIVEGDCLEVLSSFAAASIDMVLTSPPYDNLREYKGYVFNFEGIAKELYRVAKDGGVVVWVVNDATINGSETGTSFKQALYFKEIGFNLHDTMIYAKNNYIPLTHNRYEQQFEYMFVFSKGKPKCFSPMKKENKYSGIRKGGNMRTVSGESELKHKDTVVQQESIKPNIFFYNIGSGSSSKDSNAFKHPAVFPEQLARDHILSWSNENDIVLDPMCGSGTTCVAAKELKRNFIGIEIAQEYANLARERIKNMPTKLL